MHKNIFLLSVLFLIFSCSDKNEPEDASPTSVNPVDMADDMPDDTSNQVVDPLFENSIVSTNIDFITEDDTDAFSTMEYLGQEDKEMPDSTTDILFDTDTYIFKVNFSNGNDTEVWAHSSFGNQQAAQEYAEKLTSRLGKLPAFMRDELSHVVLHNGDAGAFAESEANFFVVYSQNIDVRISNNDLEETVFHETVHATLDADYLQSNVWLQAQQNDPTFITQYAMDNSNKEDMAESALFVYTMIKHPGRLDSDIETWVQTNIPNRFTFIESIFE